MLANIKIARVKRRLFLAKTKRLLPILVWYLFRPMYFPDKVLPNLYHERFVSATIQNKNFMTAFYNRTVDETPKPADSYV